MSLEATIEAHEFAVASEKRVLDERNYAGHALSAAFEAWRRCRAVRTGVVFNSMGSRQLYVEVNSCRMG